MLSYTGVQNLKEPAVDPFEATFFFILCMLGGLIAILAILWVLGEAICAIAACIQGNPVQQVILNYRVRARNNKRMNWNIGSGDMHMGLPAYARSVRVEMELPVYSVNDVVRIEPWDVHEYGVFNGMWVEDEVGLPAYSAGDMEMLEPMDEYNEFVSHGGNVLHPEYWV